jgi:hypothetical protein
VSARPAFSRRRPRLQPEQLGVRAAARHELGVAARLDDPAAVEDVDPIGRAHRREAVEDHERRVAEEQARERDLLPLAQRQVVGGQHARQHFLAEEHEAGEPRGGERFEDEDGDDLAPAGRPDQAQGAGDDARQLAPGAVAAGSLEVVDREPSPIRSHGRPDRALRTKEPRPVLGSPAVPPGPPAAFVCDRPARRRVEAPTRRGASSAIAPRVGVRRRRSRPLATACRRRSGRSRPLPTGPADAAPGTRARSAGSTASAGPCRPAGRPRRSCRAAARRSRRRRGPGCCRP